MTRVEQRVLDALTAKPMSLLELATATGLKTSTLTGAINILRRHHGVVYEEGRYRVQE